MRRAEVRVQGTPAGVLTEIEPRRAYRFVYRSDYSGPPVSMTMPVAQGEYCFDRFPAYFDGLLPEGAQLEGLLRCGKIDAHDLFTQLVAVGADLVGAVTVAAIADEAAKSATEGDSGSR